ncbi:DUF3558 family protein [Amycolatopsis rhabdoformis]|uniref:DUF3558 family protein n=1 Tax=Amycolatopsis rhabdoformis TaxID=1448059 RepID=A0ABZ1I0E4_9PSEU|nr:DUF3558 family protein [Amycolatopsis rhabdoformis]WSE27100.1 DUF3558 family protein [Amycolatopsis rhabdoformis]
MNGHRWLAGLAGLAGCLILTGCGASPPTQQEHDDTVLDHLADAPCTMMSVERGQRLGLEQLSPDPAPARTCGWHNDSQPSPYLLTFVANPSASDRQEYTREAKLTKITVENQPVTQATRAIANLTDCASLADFGTDHGFIVSVTEADASDACVLSAAYAKSTILLIRES